MSAVSKTVMVEHVRTVDPTGQTPPPSPAFRTLYFGGTESEDTTELDIALETDGYVQTFEYRRHQPPKVRTEGTAYICTSLKRT